MNPYAREEELMLSVSRDYLADAMDHADCVGLMQGEEEWADGIYDRAGFDASTHVDVAFNHTCQLTAGLNLMYPDEESV